MHDINTLRDHLFATLAALRDKENPMEIERARAVCEVAQVLTNTAKVEIDYLRHTGQTSATGFITEATGSVKDPAPSLITETTANGQRTVQQLGNGATLTRHKAF